MPTSAFFDAIDLPPGVKYKIENAPEGNYYIFFNQELGDIGAVLVEQDRKIMQMKIAFIHLGDLGDGLKEQRLNVFQLIKTEVKNTLAQQHNIKTANEQTEH